MLVGEALEWINGKILGNEFTAFTVPTVISPFLICEGCAAGRAEKLRWLVIDLIIHMMHHFIIFCLTSLSFPDLIGESSSRLVMVCRFEAIWIVRSSRTMTNRDFTDVRCTYVESFYHEKVTRRWGY